MFYLTRRKNPRWLYSQMKIVFLLKLICAIHMSSIENKRILFVCFRFILDVFIVSFDRTTTYMWKKSVFFVWECKTMMHNISSKSVKSFAKSDFTEKTKTEIKTMNKSELSGMWLELIVKIKAICYCILYPVRNCIVLGQQTKKRSFPEVGSFESKIQNFVIIYVIIIHDNKKINISIT